MQDIAGIALPPDLSLVGQEDLAAALELMLSEPAIREVAERPQHLMSPVAVLPVSIGSPHDEAHHVLESRSASVGRLRPVGAELARTQLEERAGAQAGVPLELSDPPPRSLRLVESSDSLMAELPVSPPAGPNGSSPNG